MSLATFKKKSLSITGTKMSGRPTSSVYWMNQGPFGTSATKTSDIYNYGASGFSLNGPYRSISVGKDMKMSKQGTRFRGQYPYGNGGTFGQYFEAEPVFNAGRGIITTRGNQWEFIKPSVLATKGMLEQKYRWAYNGTYPNYWVQPIYTGNQTASASQGLYIHDKSCQNDCVVDVNQVDKYVGFIKKCGPNDCQTTPARGYKMVLQQSNGPYTKFLYNPQDSSQHTMRIQRRCANPLPAQKPFPYRTTTGTTLLRGGTSVNNVATGCNTSPNFVSPPAWYTQK